MVDLKIGGKKMQIKELALIEKQVKTTEKTIFNNFKGWKKELWQHRKLIALSVLMYAIALVLNFAAGRYVEKKINFSVTDLVLDHIPTINLEYLFTYGITIIIALIFIYPLFFKIKELHVVISQFSLLILVRSFFIILTHLQQPADAIISNLPKVFDWFTFNNDLFFSAHTAIPFLGFLLFRKEKIGIFFFIATLVMAATVLLMHVHYSIDVFAAIFITYGTYRFGKFLFKKINHSEK